MVFDPYGVSGREDYFAICIEKQKKRSGENSFIIHRRVMPIDAASASLVDTLFIIEKAKKQGFLLRYWTPTEHEIKGAN